MSDLRRFLKSPPLEYQAEEGSQQLVHYVKGFQIPALPVIQGADNAIAEIFGRVMHRFTNFVRAFHTDVTPVRQAIGLYAVAHPERSEIGAEVGMYLLCRAAGADSQALSSVHHLAEKARQLFPLEGMFGYELSDDLSAEQLERVTLSNINDAAIQLTEVRKFEDYQTGTRSDIAHEYFPHPFWNDLQLDPWIVLIEILARQRSTMVVSVVLEPVVLPYREKVADIAQQFQSLAEASAHRAERLSQAAHLQTNASVAEMVVAGQGWQALRAAPKLASRIQRGAYAYGQLIAWEDQLFSMRVTLATDGIIPTALTETVRVSLCSPAANEPDSTLGWRRPVAIPARSQQQHEAALQNLRWLGQIPWQPDEREPPTNAALRQIRTLVTATEAVGLFHVPMLSQAGQTTALSTSEVPFILPPEVARISALRFKQSEQKHLIKFGYLYQRRKTVSMQRSSGDASDGLSLLEFKLLLTDLEKPSLLVGAPGSGKSNLALYILSQLWQEDRRVPFLVLDPSTGHEYRYLSGLPHLRESMLLYTLGEESDLPFRFNPFAIPPGVTVRSHITRLLACFKAAYEMWDPLPAIYEAALARVYLSFGWSLSEEGGAGHTIPCMADFAAAVSDHLDEHVLPDYGKGTEAAGILTGASKIRINSIRDNLGHILNVRENFNFQLLLQHPATIEMGALGDPSSIALVMAFLVTQLAGHIQALHQQGLRDEWPHLLVIEEAHRLLSIETSASANQGNTRGKSAEEINTLLSEVRKFRQGIMILDQRPSSLAGGVLDNALVTMLCRLNDRVGFEHLSNVLNLSPAQQKYARSRLQPGETIMLDAQSGQPVLVRAPNLIDTLRNRYTDAGWDKVRDQFTRNAQQYQLTVPIATEPSTDRRLGQTGESHGITLADHLDVQTSEAIVQALEQFDCPAARRALRTWFTLHRSEVSNLVERMIFATVVDRMDLSIPERAAILQGLQET